MKRRIKVKERQVIADKQRYLEPDSFLGSDDQPVLLGRPQDLGLLLTLVLTSRLGPRTALAERVFVRAIRIEIRVEIGQQIWYK